MPVHNREIARLLEETADLLDIQGSNQFRVRAYRNAARTVEGLPRAAAELVAEGEDLSKRKGIGGSISEKIEEIVETGELTQLNELKERLPSGLLDLTAIPELGPRRAQQLHEELGIDGVDALERAIKEDRLRELEGFGEKLTETIARRLDEAKSRRGEKKILISEAEEIANELVAYLSELEKIERLQVAGSYRRRKDRVGDLDILVIASDPGSVMDRFVEYDTVREVLSKGETRSSIILVGGIQVDLRLLSEESYGSALMYFTGSKEHNVALRSRAQEHGFKVSEYGLFRGDRREAGASEKEVYERLGLKWIPPELRENRGEIEASEAGELPFLIEESEILGDLHSHTEWSDGTGSVETMAQAAMDRGYRYLGITDHSPGLTVANGLSEKELAQQLECIAELNASFDRFALLASLEVNIEADGRLDLSQELLRRLDYTVCSIHSDMSLSREKQTERLLRAMDNRYCSIIGHPTGRRFPERAGYELDMERVLEAAAERGVAMEINAQPERLDLPDHFALAARERGVNIAISTDAHDPVHLRFIRFGVGQARRGWLTAMSVINSRPLGELRKLLRHG